MVFDNSRPTTRPQYAGRWQFYTNGVPESKSLIRLKFKQNTEWVNVFHSKKTGKRVFHFPTKMKVSFYVRDGQPDSMDKFAIKLIGPTKMVDVEKHLMLFLMMVAK
jgi:hypothetical protein